MLLACSEGYDLCPIIDVALPQAPYPLFRMAILKCVANVMHRTEGFVFERALVISWNEDNCVYTTVLIYSQNVITYTRLSMFDIIIMG